MTKTQTATLEHRYESYVECDLSKNSKHKITMDGAKWLAAVLCSTEIENPMYELWASRCLSIRDLMTNQKEIESWWNVTTLSSRTVWTDAKKNDNTWKRLLLALSALYEFSNPEIILTELPCWIVYEMLYACSWELVLRNNARLSSKAKEMYESMGSALRSISFVLYDRVFPTLSDAASNRVDMKIDASWVSRVLTSILSCDDNNENVIEIFVGGLLGINVTSIIRDSPRHGLFTQRRALLSELESKVEEKEVKEEEEEENKEEVEKTTTKVCKFEEGSLALYVLFEREA